MLDVNQIQTQPPMPQLVTLSVAGELIPGLAKWRIREFCVTGVLSHIKAGRKILINQNILLGYVNNPQNYPHRRKSANLGLRWI